MPLDEISLLHLSAEEHGVPLPASFVDLPKSNVLPTYLSPQEGLVIAAHHDRQHYFDIFTAYFLEHTLAVLRIPVSIIPCTVY